MRGKRRVHDELEKFQRKITNVSQRFPDRREFPLPGGKAPLEACVCESREVCVLFLSPRLCASKSRRKAAGREEDRAWSRSPAPRNAFIWSRNFSLPLLPSQRITHSLFHLPSFFRHPSCTPLRASSPPLPLASFASSFFYHIISLSFSFPPYVPRFHVSLSLPFDSISLFFFFLPVVLPRSSSTFERETFFSFLFLFPSFFLRFNQLGTPMRVRRVLSRGASRAWDSKHGREKEEIARRFSGKNGWRGWEGIL